MTFVANYYIEALLDLYVYTKVGISSTTLGYLLWFLSNWLGSVFFFYSEGICYSIGATV